MNKLRNWIYKKTRPKNSLSKSLLDDVDQDVINDNIKVINDTIKVINDTIKVSLDKMEKMENDIKQLKEKE